MKTKTKKQILAGVVGVTVGGVIATVVGKTLIEVGAAALVVAAGASVGWLAAEVTRKGARTKA